MKTGFYPKLAWSGITKNKKTYLPYMLTCIGMIMMFYIVSFLNRSSAVRQMPGGDTMQLILSFGTGVIGVFALIFLFYTNSFLIRRRKKEFGLYNILGMGKWNLARILVWESLIIAAFSLLGGLLTGIMFSKIAELCMARLLSGNITFSFYVEPAAIVSTLVLFAAIFALLLLNTLRQIHVSKPIELLNSETLGEKPPKANWILALLGAVILAVAYYLAVTIQDPITAMLLFFVAATMVIIASYLLFIAGSVVICKLLQKNKQYYYKTNHFISVSSMIYRMKRNGAGLASICILSTMVLVTVSSTACLYFGTESSLRDRYPRSIVLDTYSVKESDLDTVQQTVDQVLADHGLTEENTLRYRFLSVGGYLSKDEVLLDRDSYQISMNAHVVQMYFIPLEDYNLISNGNETLAKGEVMLYTTRISYPHDFINMEGFPKMKVKEQIKRLSNAPIENGWSAMTTVPTFFIIVPDMGTVEAIDQVQKDIYGEHSSTIRDYYAFDLSCDEEQQIAAYKQLNDKFNALENDAAFPRIIVESAAYERGGFYALYGGLFFLGILLGSVFLFAAVLIMYYKQVSEGYEDQSRFDIMQKVGITKKEIRKSINSQILTVFFLPLLAAGVHTAFAFPVIEKLLTVFQLNDIQLLITTMAGCYLIFALFYTLVYRITSGAYYGIVSGNDRS